MAIINLRVEEDLKKKAVRTTRSLGLDLSSAIRLFLVNLVAKKRLPFPVAAERKRGRKA